MIKHPTTPEEISQRDQLLQRTLRPPEWTLSIANEYPIVLNDADQRFSFCLTEGDIVLAHANLWPRTLVNQASKEEFSIALVGNVATDPDHQGQGHMQKLMQFLKDLATKRHYSGLILWSDLTQFYQKLGFSSASQEYRFCFSEKILTFPQTRHGCKLVHPKWPQVTDELLAALLELREPVALTVKRSVREFRQLLEIPGTDLYLILVHDQLAGYGILGKGCDMINVVHEWGVKENESLLALIAHLRREMAFKEIVLLAPVTTNTELKIALTTHAELKERHTMALLWQNPEMKTFEQNVRDLFIWGLDSI